MGVRAGTASQGNTWWSVQDFNALNNCYKFNTQGHVRRDCESQGQPKLTYSSEEFNYKVNPLGHCWECNQPGHVRKKCPDLGQPRTSYKGGQDEDIRCYNCNKCNHYSRDCTFYQRGQKKNKDLGYQPSKKSSTVLPPLFSSSFLHLMRSPLFFHFFLPYAACSKTRSSHVLREMGNRNPTQEEICLQLSC